MTPMESKRAYRRDLVLASLMVVGGLGISTVSLLELGATHLQADRTELAQSTPPLQSTPGAENKPAAPNSDTTTGMRPTATPPQPARPDTDAQKAGAKTALPPAPAEKMAPAIPAR